MKTVTTEFLSKLCSEKRCVDLQTLEHTIVLAIEIAREGREGRRIGTIFIVSDTANVLKRTRNLILDPLKGYDDDQKSITDPSVRETIKELAQMDGAFLVSDAGVVVSACRYLSAPTDGIDLPLGLGTRHIAAAAMTKVTNAVAVVVSESAVVRVFDDGELIAEIIPELWLLSRHSLHLSGPIDSRTEKEITVLSRAGEIN
jgi:diadenylate cyclase